MPSAGFRWKAAFLLFVALFGAFALWQILAKADAEVGEDIAQQELVTLALKNRAACERDPVGAAKVLGPGVCQDAKEITERPPAEKGEPGEPGARGPAGPQGEEGPRGPAGPQGATGPRGPAGVDGSSPACLLTANACTGPTGAQGLPGADGKDGQVGPEGPAGKDGQNGSDGVDGKDGADGAPGERGAQGTPGVDGRGIQSVECDSQTPITFRWTWTDGTIGTATCGGVGPTTPPPNARR